MSPDEGIYCGGSFVFRFQIPINFPHSPPKIVCLSKVIEYLQKIFHPNIDPDGNICLNILREDWNPVLSINSTVYGIQFLFLEPNCDDPLNKGLACYSFSESQDVNCSFVLECNRCARVIFLTNRTMSFFQTFIFYFCLFTLKNIRI